jgi:GntR family transcriptional regulator, transcriptional repressor for pyruvate dehydrogenase complex
MSTIQLTPARRWRLADVLYGQLLMRIVNGDVAEGDRLPSEAEIGKMFGASRPVVRQALMQLQADGLVYARKGAGTFVRMRPPARLHDFVEPADVASYLRSFELRAGLEGEAARLAAMRRTRNHLKAIEDAARALDDAITRKESGHEADFWFHMAIAEATDNELFPRVLDELADIMRGSMAMGLSLTRTGSDLRRSQVLKEHWQIADAIAAQDGEAAALYMRFHLAQTRLRTTDARSEAQAHR